MLIKDIVKNKPLRSVNEVVQGRSYPSIDGPSQKLYKTQEEFDRFLGMLKFGEGDFLTYQYTSEAWTLWQTYYCRKLIKDLSEIKHWTIGGMPNCAHIICLGGADPTYHGHPQHFEWQIGNGYRKLLDVEHEKLINADVRDYLAQRLAPFK